MDTSFRLQGKFVVISYIVKRPTDIDNVGVPLVNRQGMMVM